MTLKFESKFKICGRVSKIKSLKSDHGHSPWSIDISKFNIFSMQLHRNTQNYKEMTMDHKLWSIIIYSFLELSATYIDHGLSLVSGKRIKKRGPKASFAIRFVGTTQTN